MRNDEFILSSKQIHDNAKKFILKTKPKTIHCFLPIKSKMEFDTEPIINFCWDNSIKVVVPVSDFKSATMKSAEFKRNSQTTVTKYNIPEPINPIWVDEKNIDMVITPLLAFDLNGYRVGYGKGFYDRFFKLLRTDAQKVGVSLFPPIDKIKDISPFDVQLTNCISPEKTFSF